MGNTIVDRQKEMKKIKTIGKDNSIINKLNLQFELEAKKTNMYEDIIRHDDEILKELRIILMKPCSNRKDFDKILEIYNGIKDYNAKIHNDILYMTILHNKIIYHNEMLLEKKIGILFSGISDIKKNHDVYFTHHKKLNDFYNKFSKLFPVEDGDKVNDTYSVRMEKCISIVGGMETNMHNIIKEYEKTNNIPNGNDAKIEELIEIIDNNHV